MFSGRKAQRRLALYVALGLSAGGGLLPAQDAYAAHIVNVGPNDPATSGIEGTRHTASLTDNIVTIGNASTPDKPFVSFGGVSGGGLYDTTNSVENNTLTIHHIKISNDPIYGGRSSSGAVLNNTVTFENGTAANSNIYGGYIANASSQEIRGNKVFIQGGTLGKTVYGGHANYSMGAVHDNHVTVSGGMAKSDVFGGSTMGTGAVTSNSVTITGGRFGDEAAGGVVTNASNSSDVTGNTLTISGGTFTKSGGTKVFGVYTAGSGKAENNSATVGGIDNTDLNVYGAYAAGAGNAVNNHVTITGTGKVGGVYAGRAESSTGKAERNTITIEPGGWAENNVFGGYAKGGVKGNIVNIKGTVNATVYGGRLLGGGTADANEVHLDGAVVKNQVIGAEGDNGALVKENRASVTNSLVKDDVIGGFSRGTNGKAERNTVSVMGAGAKVTGDVYGARAVDHAAAEENEVTISSGTFEKGVYGAYTNGTGTLTRNVVTISDGTFRGLVSGGYSLTAGLVTGNKIHVSGGTFESGLYAGYADKYGTVTGNVLKITGGVFKNTVYGGAGGDTAAAYTTKTFAANNNTVTIAGGTFSKNIYGGMSWHANGKTENNTVNLGDDTHTDLSGTTLTNSYIYGGNQAATGNTLNVNARNVAVYSVNNFENYKFKLNSATAFGDTMLTVSNAGDFAGTGVDFGKLTVDRMALSDVSHLHGIHRITLLKRSSAADTLKFQNYGAAESGTATGTHEFGLVTDTDTDEANAVLFEVSRFKGSEVAYDGTTETHAGEIYGGLSRYGHTTMGNALTVTGIRGTDDPQFAYGGKNMGTTGDVTHNTVTVNLAHDTDTIEEVHGGQASHEDNSGMIDHNTANMQKGTVSLLYGGYTFGDGAVTNNTVNFSGGKSTGYIGGGYIDKAASVAEVSYNKVLFTDGTAEQIRGGMTIGSGEAKKNTVTISGGTVNAEVAGGVGYTVTANTVTISGGTVSGHVYGGKSAGPGSSTSGNIVNLGAENGVYTATLTNAALHGDNNSGTGATLNVRAKNITAKSADKFENYKFHLNDDIAQNGGSMLTLTENNGFNGGNLFDWTKLDVDTSKLSGSTVIGKATLLTGTTNGLKFSNYAGRNKTTAATNGDYETALRTDTNAATASKVILDYNRFQNNTNAAYDGSNAPTQLADGTTEVYGGISYAGNTTKNNHLTISNLQADLNFAYGGKTAASAGNTVNNSVTVTGTGTKKIDNINGGYAGAVNAIAEKNRVTITDGTVTNVMGGAVSGTNASATDNHVFIKGGRIVNAVGGGTATAAGSMSRNSVTVTGGTLTGQIVGGHTSQLTSASNNNVINLGDDTGTYTANLSGAQIWGTSYDGNVLANSDIRIAGNTLNVKAKNGAEVAKVRNVQKFSFQLHDDTTKTAPLLKMADADGFGANAAVKWENVTVDLSKVTTATDAAKIQGKNTYTLMRGANNKLKFSDYAARYGTYAGVYETGLRTDTTANSGTVTATNVLYDINRFKDGRVTYTAASTGEAVGGYSVFGNTTTGSHLTVSGVTGTLAAAYGAQTAGTAGGSVNNKVTVTGTGTGSVTNVYGGAITKAANDGSVTGNTVTLSGGKVTGAVYGGYTSGSGRTTGNTVNIGADPTTMRQGDASTLAAGTNFTAAELYGGSKSDNAAGNTLNVTVKDAAAKKAQNFERYTFYLTNSAAADKPSSGAVDDTYTTSRGTMLTLANGFDGQTADWDKVTVDTSKLSADKTLGAITLMKSTAANKLKFSNYAAKNHAVSGDYEVVQRTDTNTGEASSVLIDVNRFRNGAVVYDGVNPHAKTYAGVSYGGNTAERNAMTLTSIAAGNTVKWLSGGRSEGVSGGAASNTVNIVGTGAGTLEKVYGGYIGNAANAADAAGNTVNIAGGTVQTVYGGYTNGTGKTTGNTVNIGYTDEHGAFHAVADGTRVTGTIYGGKSGDVTGNTLNVRGALTAGQIANFEKLNFAVNRDTAGKTLLSLNGGAQTTGLDWQKLTADIAVTDLPTKSYAATRVTLMANDKGIDFGTTYDKPKDVVAGDVYEFSVDTDTHAKNGTSVYADGYRFKGNTAAFAATDGTHAEAWGGKSVLGHTAEGNTLTITGGTITDTAYGGTSRKGKAQNNRIVMRGGDVQTLRGGFGESASGNTVDVFGGTVRGDVYGGHATAGAATDNAVHLRGAAAIGGVIRGGVGTAGSTGNTLAVHAFGAAAKDFEGVQNLHFYLPSGTAAAETRTMLTLTHAPAVKDISTLNLGVGAVAADARALRPGDAVSLLKVNGTLMTAGQPMNTGSAYTMTASQGGTLDYTLALAKRGENELVATVQTVTVNEKSKSLVETRAAASAMLNAGADLLTNVGFTAAASAATETVPAAADAEGARNTGGSRTAMPAPESPAADGGFQPWAAQGGAAVRLHSGSYVDAKGWHLNVGFARRQRSGQSALTYGPFVEHGRSTYNSYLDDGTHGSGKMSYTGGGMMARAENAGGGYIEGSLRAGRVSSDYTGGYGGTDMSYDHASTYYAAHLGIGQERRLAGGDRIEGYAKYFYSHQGGNTTKLRSGAVHDFGSVDSHRLRVGARYTHADSARSEIYAGLAYEYEFGGEATASYQGYSTPSPSLGGGTGILELGYRFAPRAGRISCGVNIMGMQGKREGLSGGVQLNWAF